MNSKREKKQYLAPAITVINVSLEHDIVATSANIIGGPPSSVTIEDWDTSVDFKDENYTIGN